MLVLGLNKLLGERDDSLESGSEVPSFVPGSLDAVVCDGLVDLLSKHEPSPLLTLANLEVLCASSSLVINDPCHPGYDCT